MIIGVIRNKDNIQAVSSSRGMVQIATGRSHTQLTKPMAPQALIGPPSSHTLFKRSNPAAQYARSDFCLMPPGDTLARQGIVDAIAVGCVPVFFHPGQLSLW